MSDTTRAPAATFPNPGAISHWFKQLYGSEPLQLRDPLPGNRDADVCIVGAGYTGLWTAYALLRADPTLRVVLLEANMAGYGASGRNGGAVIAQFNGSREYWTRLGGRQGAIAMERAVRATVDEVGAAVAREGIDCSFSRNGVIVVARTPLELERFRASVEEDRRFGFGEESSRILDATEVQKRIRVEGALGARFNPDCASIDPGRLVRGLAEAVERLGARIYEGTRVTRIAPGVVTTAFGTVRAPIVLRATEAYTQDIEGQQRRFVPVHTSMLATAVIPDELWHQIGWADREALLAEHPFLHLQHTSDHRITIGGDDNRIPYLYGSRPSPDAPAPPRVRTMYHRELVRLFPALSDVPIEHSWQGVFAATRAWAPSVGLDRTTGLAWAGGYVGEGVAISNLAARSVADLILGRDTELTRLPWTNQRPRRWEPEPLRMFGAAMIAGMRYVGDRAEARTGRSSRLIELGNRAAGFTGHIG